MDFDDAQFERRTRAAVLSVVIGVVMFCMKMGAYIITGSAAILSDALESVVHVIATGFALYSVWLSSRPADRSHPYGHGRIEFFSAGIEGTLILIAALWIGVVSVPKLIGPPELTDLGLGTSVTALAAVVNLWLGWHLIRVGRRENSLTLVADGKHVLTDSITSFGVVAGLALVLATGLKILDPIVALAVAANIIVTGIRLMRQSIGGLMDEADPAWVREVTEILNREREAEWIDVHRLRCWRSGEIHHLDFHLTLPYYLEVARAHDIETRINSALSTATNRRIQLLIHHDPCTENCCSFCAVRDCAVRQHPLTVQRTFDAATVIHSAQYVSDDSR